MSIHEVIIRGGLGNQIFCLFYAYKIHLKYKTKVAFNLTNYLISNKTNRFFILDSLYPPLQDEFNYKLNFISKFLYIFIRIVDKLFVKSNTSYLPGDKPFFLSYWPNRYIHSGYFQKIDGSELDNKCFELIKEKMKPYIIRKKINYLAIHIRRGDYLQEKHSIHGIIPEKYFLQEAKEKLSLNSYEGITIFSDSPNLIKFDIFKTLHNNVKLDKGGEPLEVFIRMANHKGLIASNSSFSLWAGILGDISYFSIPNYWMKGIKSSVLGFRNIQRYKCYLN